MLSFTYKAWTWNIFLERSHMQEKDLNLRYHLPTHNSRTLTCGMEKAMASHSSTLAWKIPWMEEPGGLQSMGSLRVGHD